jgi:hypothetical protein
MGMSSQVGFAYDRHDIARGIFNVLRSQVGRGTRCPQTITLLTLDGVLDVNAFESHASSGTLGTCAGPIGRRQH